MTAITENDLKRLEDLINNRFDALNERIQGVEIKLAIVITKVEGLEKRFDDNNKRIDELRFL